MALMWKAVKQVLMAKTLPGGGMTARVEVISLAFDVGNLPR